MALRPFKLGRNELYIACYRPVKLSNGSYSGLIGVYELLKPENQNMVTSTEWSFKPEIVDPDSTIGYNSLEINGQLIDYDKLLQDLCKSRLRVNKVGCCYFELKEGVAETETYRFTFYRMNDIWKWSDYGVEVDFLSDNTIVNGWDHRRYILDGSKTPYFAHHDVQIISKELEKVKIELKEKTDEAKSLRSRLDLKENEIRTWKKILNEKDKRSSDEEEIERSIDQVKKLQSVEVHDSTIICKIRAPSSVFDVRRRTYVPKNATTEGDRWESMFGHKWFGNFTPASLPRPVSQEQSNNRRPLPFTMFVSHEFDPCNWFYMGVKERVTPILVYEGSNHSVEIGGHRVSVPIDSTAYVTFEPHLNSSIAFGPTILSGYGPRMAIRTAMLVDSEWFDT